MDILLRHDQFYVINKPVGIGMHQEGDSPGLVRRLGEALGESLYPVHRLDKMTTGALLLARTAEANRELSRQFAERIPRKHYLALTDRKPAKKQGLIRGDMEKARGGSWKLSRSQVNPAITRFYSTLLAEGLRALLLQPYTGRTHQLRVAMKSLGSPILGDERYGGSPADRGYLHAWKLDFQWQGRLVSVTAPADQGALFGELAEPLTRWAATLLTKESFPAAP